MRTSVPRRRAARRQCAARGTHRRAAAGSMLLGEVGQRQARHAPAVLQGPNALPCARDAARVRRRGASGAEGASGVRPAARGATHCARTPEEELHHREDAPGPLHGYCGVGKRVQLEAMAYGELWQLSIAGCAGGWLESSVTKAQCQVTRWQAPRPERFPDCRVSLEAGAGGGLCHCAPARAARLPALPAPRPGALGKVAARPQSHDGRHPARRAPFAPRSGRIAPGADPPQPL